LNPYQGPKQRDKPLLLGRVQGALFCLLDQLLDFRLLDLDRLWIFYRHNRARKSLASGYTHTVLIGTWAIR